MSDNEWLWHYSTARFKSSNVHIIAHDHYKDHDCLQIERIDVDDWHTRKLNDHQKQL